LYRVLLVQSELTNAKGEHIVCTQMVNNRFNCARDGIKEAANYIHNTAKLQVFPLSVQSETRSFSRPVTRAGKLAAARWNAVMLRHFRCCPETHAAWRSGARAKGCSHDDNWSNLITRSLVSYKSSAKIQ